MHTREPAKPAPSRATPRPAALVPVLTLATLGPAARAQCEGPPYTCEPPSPKFVYRVGDDPEDLTCYTPSPTPPFTPDRRPGFVLSMACGDCLSCDNPLEQAPWWMQASWPSFQTRLNQAWANGFRRVLLFKPGGSLYTQKVQQAHYGYLTDEQKHLLNTELFDWIHRARLADPDFDIGVFLGAWQSGSTCTPCVTDAGSNGYWDCSDEEAELGFEFNTRLFNPTDRSSMEEVYHNLMPWMDIGCSSLWLDNAAHKLPKDVGDYPGHDRLLDLTQSPDYAGVKILGEAIPSYADGYMMERPVAHAAWFAHLQFLIGDDDGVPIGKGWLTGGARDDQLVDPTTSELIVLFANPDGSGDGPPYTIETMADARDRGYIVWVNNETAVPMLQRLYDGEDDAFYQASAGALSDFNGDGAVNCTDYTLFLRNWFVTRSDATFGADYAVWDGDINNDDLVDSRDILDFSSLEDWTTMGCQ